MGWTVRPKAENVAQGLEAAVDELASGWTAPASAPLEMTRPHQAKQMAALFDETVGAPAAQSSEEDR